MYVLARAARRRSKQALRTCTRKEKKLNIQIPHNIFWQHASIPLSPLSALITPTS